MSYFVKLIVKKTNKIFSQYFEKAMETKTKLILVLGPKMKSFICEAAKSNKTCELIKKTIKVLYNFFITKFNEFKLYRFYISLQL